MGHAATEMKDEKKEEANKGADEKSKLPAKKDNDDGSPHHNQHASAIPSQQGDAIDSNDDEGAKPMPLPCSADIEQPNATGCESSSKETTSLIPGKEGDCESSDQEKAEGIAKFSKPDDQLDSQPNSPRKDPTAPDTKPPCEESPAHGKEEEAEGTTKPSEPDTASKEPAKSGANVPCQQQSLKDEEETGQVNKQPNAEGPNSSATSSDYETTMMIPVSRCGVLIGTHGSNITRIREFASVTAILQDVGHKQTDEEKPLRIVGPRDRVELAVEMVRELLDVGSLSRYHRGGHNNSNRRGPAFTSSYYGHPHTAVQHPQRFNRSNVGGRFSGEGHHGYRNHKFEEARAAIQQTGLGAEVEVPGFAVGFIIGRGGESIRTLSERTGTSVQFNREDTFRQSQMHHAIIQGTPEQVQTCIEQMNELVREVHTQCLRKAHFTASPTHGNAPTAGRRDSATAYNYLQEHAGDAATPSPYFYSGYFGNNATTPTPAFTPYLQPQQGFFMDGATSNMGLLNPAGLLGTPPVGYYEAMGGYAQPNLMRQGFANAGGGPFITGFTPN